MPDRQTPDFHSATLHSCFVDFDLPHKLYTNSGFSRSVRSSHSWFSSFKYPGLALIAAFFEFCFLHQNQMKRMIQSDTQ